MCTPLIGFNQIVFEIQIQVYRIYRQITAHTQQHYIEPASTCRQTSFAERRATPQLCPMTNIPPFLYKWWHICKEHQPCPRFSILLSHSPRLSERKGGKVVFLDHNVLTASQVDSWLRWAGVLRLIQWLHTLPLLWLLWALADTGSAVMPPLPVFTMWLQRGHFVIFFINPLKAWSHQHLKHNLSRPTARKDPDEDFHRQCFVVGFAFLILPLHIHGDEWDLQ